MNEYEKALTTTPLDRPWEQLELGGRFLLVEDGYMREQLYLYQETEETWKEWMDIYGGVDKVKIYKLKKRKLDETLFGDKAHQLEMGWVE